MYRSNALISGFRISANQGVPYQKAKHPLGKGVVGLDIGPSTLAVVSNIYALLRQFCVQLARCDKDIRRLQRQLGRQRRANNPGNYNADGTIRSGKQTWKKSRRQQVTYRKSLRGQFAEKRGDNQLVQNAASQYPCAVLG